MKVLYDSQTFSGQIFGGISGYFNQLITNRRNLFDCEVSGYISNNVYVHQFSDMRPFFEGISFKGKHKLMKAINRASDKKAILKENYDLFHPTYYEAVCYPKDKPVVITAHDFNSELLPQHFPDQAITAYKRKSFQRADRIICISENTKKDLLMLFPDIPEEKTDVVYHALPWRILPELSYEEKQNHPYILYTGVRKGYKNFDRFARSISTLLKEYELYLLCTGHGFSEEEMNLFSDLGISDRVTHYYAKDEKELQDLYQHALMFVYPSLYEGFGFPILEAFSCGCPVALSNSSCFPEIAGKGGLYFDPTNEQSIHNAVRTVLTNKKIRNDLIQAGFNRFQQFSVEKMVNETFRVYQSVL